MKTQPLFSKKSTTSIDLPVRRSQLLRKRVPNKSATRDSKQESWKGTGVERLSSPPTLPSSRIPPWSHHHAAPRSDWCHQGDWNRFEFAKQLCYPLIEQKKLNMEGENGNLWSKSSQPSGIRSSSHSWWLMTCSQGTEILDHSSSLSQPGTTNSQVLLGSLPPSSWPAFSWHTVFCSLSSYWLFKISGLQQFQSMSLLGVPYALRSHYREWW
jgi:hypothetical protein